MIKIHNRLLRHGYVLHAVRDELDLLRIHPLHPLYVVWWHAQKEVFDVDFIDDNTINGDDGEHARAFRIQNNLISNPTLRWEDAQAELKKTFTQITFVCTKLCGILIVGDLSSVRELILERIPRAEKLAVTLSDKKNASGLLSLFDYCLIRKENALLEGLSDPLFGFRCHPEHLWDNFLEKIHLIIEACLPCGCRKYARTVGICEDGPLSIICSKSGHGYPTESNHAFHVLVCVLSSLWWRVGAIQWQA